MAEASPDDAALSYEELVEALERVTNRLASGDLGIEDAADLYEEAGRLHALASERLEKVQQRIERLQDVTSEEPGAR
jgi:exodeoxyribonuclease VII small subunit